MPPFRPGKPAWIAGQSVNQAIAGGSATDLVWDVLEWEDPAGLFTSTSSLVVTRPGLYQQQVIVTRAAAATSSPVTVRVRVNGATVVLNQSPSAAGTMTVVLPRLLRLVVGDELRINVTLHNTAAASTSAPSTEWQGFRAGPERWTG